MIVTECNGPLMIVDCLSKVLLLLQTDAARICAKSGSKCNREFNDIHAPTRFCHNNYDSSAEIQDTRYKMDCDRFEAPYAVLNRKERSRELAQKRRTTYKSLMKDLAEELPFSKDVVSQIDYNSRLRLALCYFRMKNILGKGNKADPLQEKLASLENGKFTMSLH